MPRTAAATSSASVSNSCCFPASAAPGRGGGVSAFSGKREGSSSGSPHRRRLGPPSGLTGNHPASFVKTASHLRLHLAGLLRRALGFPRGRPVVSCPWTGCAPERPLGSAWRLSWRQNPKPVSRRTEYAVGSGCSGPGWPSRGGHAIQATRYMKPRCRFGNWSWPIPTHLHLRGGIHSRFPCKDKTNAVGGKTLKAWRTVHSTLNFRSIPYQSGHPGVSHLTPQSPSYFFGLSEN